MNSGAHPDDETSAMLALLRFGYGFSISFACATRGEGGQNDIGHEMARDLGALRTAEMEAACSVLGMRLYWLSEGPEDTIRDFGFSKSRSETQAKWSQERTLARLVEIVRTERPDIICPTFLDVPGQHGHHRAMTQAAFQVMSAAADPEFPSNLAPWQPIKLYLPAWSGAGRSYDDDLPPPLETLTLCGRGREPISGWSWERIGQQSRCFHRSQGMGTWVKAGNERDWPLHLARSIVAGPDEGLASGLPGTLSDFADLPVAGPIARELRSAHASLAEAVSAFPDFGSVARLAGIALVHIRNARQDCPQALRGQLLHRLTEKEIQLGHVIRLALGVEARGSIDDTWLRPGDSYSIDLELHQGSASAISTAIVATHGNKADLKQLQVGTKAVPADPYLSHFDPALPPQPALNIAITHDGVTSTCRVALEETPFVLTGNTVELHRDRALLNLKQSGRSIEFMVLEQHPPEAEPSLAVPEGWKANRTEQGFRVTVPPDAREGLYNIPLLLDRARAHLIHKIAYSHVRPTVGYRDALRVLVLEAELPEVQIGYFGGGNDRTNLWLAALGAEVEELDDDALCSNGRLDRTDTIVIGIFAMRVRPALRAAMPRIHDWIKAGGTLVTLYHRPWDNWNPDQVPPRRLEIGSPSLRWRVTDEASRVDHRAPDHPILNWPNKITADDWAGWHKERGLYFAKQWDNVYEPLVEMADQGEAPHQGALLAADIGSGRHVHCALALHHQMEQLVPGAFRLMANLIASRQ